MDRSSFAFILIVVSSLTSLSLHAQTNSPPADPAEVARLRVMNAVERQKNAVARMSVSIASQRSAVERQRQNLSSANFVDLQPTGTFSSGAASAPCDSLPTGEV